MLTGISETARCAVFYNFTKGAKILLFSPFKPLLSLSHAHRLVTLKPVNLFSALYCSNPLRCARHSRSLCLRMTGKLVFCCVSDGCALQAFPLRGRWHFCPIRAKMTDEVSPKNSAVIAITPHQSPIGDSFPSRGSLSGERRSPMHTPAIYTAKL